MKYSELRNLFNQEKRNSLAREGDLFKRKMYECFEGNFDLVSQNPSSFTAGVLVLKKFSNELFNLPDDIWKAFHFSHSLLTLYPSAQSLSIAVIGTDVNNIKPIVLVPYFWSNLMDNDLVNSLGGIINIGSMVVDCLNLNITDVNSFGDDIKHRANNFESEFLRQIDDLEPNKYQSNLLSDYSKFEEGILYTRKTIDVDITDPVLQ
jgi:hypothetical protein